MSVRVETVLADADWRRLGDPAALIQRAAEAVLRHFPAMTGRCEVSVLLADDEAVRELNRQWRGKDSPTNILSFPALPTPGVPAGAAVFLGDMALARQTVEREAAGRGIAVNDHLTHLAVHGMLHLIGYDHETDVDATEMERLEIAILETLGIDDPYRAHSNEHAPARQPVEQITNG